MIFLMFWNTLLSLATSILTLFEFQNASPETSILTIAPTVSPKPWIGTLGGILFVATLAALVTQLANLPAIKGFGVSPLVLGIVTGMLVGNFNHRTIPSSWSKGINLSAKKLLRIAVAFYGLNISIQQIIEIGLPGLMLSTVVVLAVLGIGTWVGIKIFRLDRDTAMLASAGSAICGAAAVLAFESTLRAPAHKSAVAIASVVIFGTLSMFLYPILIQTGLLNLDARAAGLFLGATVHEVAQVVASASNISPEATEVATIVKMTRVALLVPVLLLLGFWLNQRARQQGQGKQQSKAPIPWFLIGFLLIALAHSSHVIPQDALVFMRAVDLFALTMAMTALGIETRFAQLKAAGPQVMGLALSLFMLLGMGGYLLVKLAS